MSIVSLCIFAAMRNFCFKLFVSVIFCGCSAYAVGQQKGGFTETLEQWSADEDLSAASVAFCAIDLKSGALIEGFNADKAMIPASLMKIPTTIAALDILGPEFRFSTTFSYRGFIDENRVLHGDLLIEGSGDPTFGSSRLGERADWLIARFAESIKRLGISEVAGNVVVADELIIPEARGTWSWEDLSNYYAAVPRQLNFLENQFTMVFRTTGVGVPAELISVTPTIPDLKIEVKVVGAEISGDQSYCFGHPLKNEIEVRGKLPVNKSSFSVKGAIPQPGVLFAKNVMEAANRLGVIWNGQILLGDSEANSNETKELLISYDSPPLSDIVVATNQRSVNLFAEALIEVMGSRSESNQSGIEVLEEYWNSKIPSGSRGMQLKDGSGLSHYNTLTAKQLAEMLRDVYLGDNKMFFEGSLPVSGKSGTLSRLGSGTVLEDNLRAKSGYMSGSRGYAGYLNLSSGRKIAFAVMVNHYDISAGAMRTKLENLMVEIARKQ